MPDVEESDLDRFVSAQDPVWMDVMSELLEGQKTTHWMWFVFPQLATLGMSETSRYFGIKDLREARAYVAHPILGPRLQRVGTLLLSWSGVPAETLLGEVDALKLKSSATLFAVASGDPLWKEVLVQFFQSRSDPVTLSHLQADKEMCGLVSVDVPCQYQTGPK